MKRKQTGVLGSRKKRVYSRNKTIKRKRRMSNKGKYKKRRMTPSSQYKASSVSFKAKAVRVKKKKVLRVPAPVRDAILRTVAGPKGKLTYKLTLAGGGLYPAQFFDNVQTVFANMPVGTDYTLLVDSGYEFTVDSYYNIAGLLSNGVAKFTNNTSFWNPTFTYRIGSTKLEVLDSYVSWELKNASVRTMRIKVFEVKPKSKSSFVYSDPGKVWAENAGVYTIATNPQYSGLKLIGNEWADSLTSENTDSIHYTTYNIATNAKAALAPTRMGLEPNNKHFNVNWSSNQVKEIILEPGQVSTVSLRGANHCTLDLDKMIDDQTTYMNVQPKFTRGVIFVVSLDQIAGGTTGFGRGNITASGTGLCIEKKYKFSFISPFPTPTGKDVIVEDYVANPIVGTHGEPTDEAVVTT